MLKTLVSLMGAVIVLSACEQSSPPPAINVNLTIEEEKEQRKPLMPKGERSTVQGDGQRFTRP